MRRHRHRPCGRAVQAGGALIRDLAARKSVEIARVAIGDEAIVFDDQDGSRPEDLAASCKSSVYDLTMHLHADLPRRVV